MDNNREYKNKKREFVFRKMPNNYEAEQSLLGAIMIDINVCNDIVSRVRAADFYYESHQLIFDVMQRLSSMQKPIDMVTISDLLDKETKLDKVGGISYITDLACLLPSTANYRAYVDMVLRDSKFRELITAANSIIENCCESDSMEKSMSFAEKAMFDVTFSVENKDLLHISHGLTATMHNFENILTNQNIATGLLTGFNNLDRIIKGYQPGQMVVLAARPGCGKTSFAMNIVSNIALMHPEKVIAVFNLEMSMEELAQRLVLSVARISRDTILSKNAGGVFKKIWEVNEKLSNTKIFVDDTTGTTPEVIMSKCRRLKQREKRLDFVVIDYLQLLRCATPKSSFQVEVADISRAIKIMAKELKVPVLILSQTSRDLEKRDDKTPKLSDLRDSGAIEQDADQVYFLTKEESTENAEFEVIDLNILKHRSGSTGKIKFKWQGDIVRFTDLSEYEKAPKEDKPKANEDSDSDTPSVLQPVSVLDDRQPTFTMDGVSVTELKEQEIATIERESSSNSVNEPKSDFDDSQPIPDGITADMTAGDLAKLLGGANKVVKDVSGDFE